MNSSKNFSRSYKLEAKSCPAAARRQRGVTLLDTIVGTALMLVIFLGIAAAFQLSVDVVSNNKARAGAVALANERMEYIRSLPYASVGTMGGIPFGTIAQSETVVLNGVTYTRRTVVEYVDDPKDGTGVADTNGITTDYKAAKVDVAWTSHAGTRHVALVSRLETPNGMETSCTPPCGTLSLSVINAASQALSGASVSIVNPSTTPAVSINTFTNASGTASFIGAPAASGYQIVVSKTGFSTAQTYSVTSQNTNPSPGNLTVSNNQTTSGTFAIDVLGQKTISSWTQILQGTWTDPLNDASKIATSSNITVASSVAKISAGASSGLLQSVAIAPVYLARWKTLYWTDSKPSGSSILYQVYDVNGATLISDSQLPGNSAGFTTSPVSLLGVSTSTYTGIRLYAALSVGATTSPSIDSWSVDYDYGPQPLPNIAFTLQGAKTIGSGPSGTLYKYSQNANSGAGASIVMPNLEWDTYTLSINGASGYDIASSCPNPQPEALPPGAAQTASLFLSAHTANSLLVDVRAASSGALIPNATAHLWQSGYSATSTTDSCGQAFFSNLSSSAYSISVSATGYTTYNSSTVNVSGTSRLSVTLN